MNSKNLKGFLCLIFLCVVLWVLMHFSNESRNIYALTFCFSVIPDRDFSEENPSVLLQ